MDLRLLGRVLWRFRLVVAAGVLLALVLALLTFVRVDFDGVQPEFSYREKEIWESQALLFVTQEGFPWGRTVIEPEEEVEPETGTGTRRGTERRDEPRFADPDRLGGLAILYARLATSDPVLDRVRLDGQIAGKIDASPVLATETLDESLRAQLRYETPLPLVRVSARATAPGVARDLAGREVDAFLAYIAERQQGGGIPRGERVEITVLERPSGPEVVDGRSRLYPALALVAAITVTLGLAFALENLLPRPRELEAGERRLAAVAEDRRRSA